MKSFINSLFINIDIIIKNTYVCDKSVKMSEIEKIESRIKTPLIVLPEDFEDVDIPVIRDNKLPKRYKFHEDNQYGKFGETAVAKKLCETYGELEIYQLENDNGDFDLKFIDLEVEQMISVEVKSDIVCHETMYGYVNDVLCIMLKHDTKNMFIEYTCSGKPSGPFKSKADMFVYYFPFLNVMYTISVKRLKDIIERDKNELRLSESVGENGNVTGYVLPISKYEKHFIKQQIDYVHPIKKIYTSGDDSKNTVFLQREDTPTQ